MQTAQCCISKSYYTLLSTGPATSRTPGPFSQTWLLTCLLITGPVLASVGRGLTGNHLSLLSWLNLILRKVTSGLAFIYPLIHFWGPPQWSSYHRGHFCQAQDWPRHFRPSRHPGEKIVNEILTHKSILSKMTSNIVSYQKECQKRLTQGMTLTMALKNQGSLVPLKCNVAMFNKHQDSSTYTSPRPLLTPSCTYEQRDIPMAVF